MTISTRAFTAQKVSLLGWGRRERGGVTSESPPTLQVTLEGKHTVHKPWRPEDEWAGYFSFTFLTWQNEGVGLGEFRGLFRLSQLLILISK